MISNGFFSSKDQWLHKLVLHSSQIRLTLNKNQGIYGGGRLSYFSTSCWVKYYFLLLVLMIFCSIIFIFNEVFSFVQQIFSEYLLCVSHHISYWWNKIKQDMLPFVTFLNHKPYWGQNTSSYKAIFIMYMILL